MRRRAGRQRPCTNGAATNPATSHQARHDPDHELLSANVRLAKHRQALLDANRIERKAFREHARVENAAAAYARELAALLDEAIGDRWRTHLEELQGLAAYADEIAAKRARDKWTVPTTLERELATNPFLRADDPAMMAKWGGAAPYETFAALRAAKDDF
jgi:hypothetical protein